MIRELKISDLKSVEQIEKESFKDPWSRSAFLQILMMENGWAIVCDEKGVIGYGILIALESYIHIVNLAVKISYRRRGIGTRILATLLEYGIKKGKKFVTLEVRAYNLPAINLYERLGFRKTKIKKSYYPDSENAIVMKRKLNLVKICG